jgi:hypothetical protein
MIPVDTISGVWDSLMVIVNDVDYGVEDPLTLLFVLGANIGLDGPP